MSEHYCKIHQKELKHRGRGIYDHRAKLNEDKEPDPKGFWYYCQGNGWRFNLRQE